MNAGIRWLLLIVALAVVAVAFLRSPAPDDARRAQPTQASPDRSVEAQPGQAPIAQQNQRARQGQRETATRLGEIALAALPPEARATLSTMRRGGPFPYAKDGTVFGNREGLLPRRPRGHYTEYTVNTPGARDRGARRIVAGGDPQRDDEFWYTDDHYRSFSRIREHLR